MIWIDRCSWQLRLGLFSKNRSCFLWLQYSLENTRSMASLSMAIFSLRSCCSCNYVSTNRNITSATSTAGLDLRLSLSSNPKRRRVLQHAGKPLSAVGSGGILASNYNYQSLTIESNFLCFCLLLGLEASITDPKDNAITLKNAEVVLESREENKIQVKLCAITGFCSSLFKPSCKKKQYFVAKFLLLSNSIFSCEWSCLEMRHRRCLIRFW